MIENRFDYTICAQSSAQGPGAVSIVRLSGGRSLEILDGIFRAKSGKSLKTTPGNKIVFGNVIDPDTSSVLDEVLVAVYHAPHSYTGEESAEVFCHGSDFIVQSILRLLISHGARMAAPGEFTQRAFLNGRMDLSQAEAVADLIASETQAAHDVALHQLKGGFSDELRTMRTELVDMVSLMELELDFSEEDVEFADRTRLLTLLDRLQTHIHTLTDSFAYGNAIKNGVPVAIAGATNTGKSTLLNALLGEERAIVSPIPGTTRDSIEDTICIDGITFRFIDTAGIRETGETVEQIGIERAYQKMKGASIVLLVLDATRPETFDGSLTDLARHIGEVGDSEAVGSLSGTGADSGYGSGEGVYCCRRQDIIILINKSDAAAVDGPMIDSVAASAASAGLSPALILPVSAKQRSGLPQLTSFLSESRKKLKTASCATTVTNLRHYEALTAANAALDRVRSGMTAGLSTELLTQDIHEALHFIGSITGEITVEEVLGGIFGRFCIGK